MTTPENVYAVRSDLFKYGLPRGLLVNPGRVCGSVLAVNDSFELDGHGFATGDVLYFRVESGGALPAPIVTGQAYYAIETVSNSFFKVASSSGGPAIDLTTDGSAVVVATPLPFDEVLEFYSRFVDGCLPAHLVPLVSPYPIIVVATVAELSAKKLLLFAGQSSASMTEAELAARAQVERWAKGMPLRDARATAPADLAYSESVTNPRGWGGGGVIGGILP